jgi:Asp-tRNA(Asn)/Glu-tRNA(Gln) amidotransferase A subunit family amidase
MFGHGYRMNWRRRSTTLWPHWRRPARVSDAEMPEGPFEDAAELTILIEAASAFQTLIRSGDCARLDDALGQINGYASEQFSATDYLHVQRVRAFLQRKVDKLFDSFDVLATAGQQSVAQRLTPAPRPQRPSPQPRPAANRNAQSKPPDGVSSLCGLPALAVPCGFNSEGLPMAIQFIGRAGNDHAVIAAARMYQGLTEWHKLSTARASGLTLEVSQVGL